MSDLRQYEQVRIVRLLRSPEHHNGWQVNKRSPAVGDVGCLIDILRSPGAPADYVVEASGPDGVMVWLGDFLAEELERIDPETG